MKTIEVDEELYRYIASHTQHIGESASDILRRMLKFTDVLRVAGNITVKLFVDFNSFHLYPILFFLLRT